MQISSLGTADSLQVSTGSAYISFYETAKTHISEGLALTTVIEEDEDYEDECTQIFVKGPYDRTTVVQVESSFTVEDVFLHADIGTNSNIFCTFGGQILNKMSQLRHYKIPHNATIFCNLRIAGYGLGFFSIKTLTGITIPLSLELFDRYSTINEIRAWIQDEEGIPQDQQRLVFNGQQLDPAKLIDDYGIRGGHAVHLVLRLPWGATYSAAEEASSSGSAKSYCPHCSIAHPPPNLSQWNKLMRRSKLSAIFRFPR
jgi:ubiquitin C